MSHLVGFNVSLNREEVDESEGDCSVAQIGEHRGDCSIGEHKQGTSLLIWLAVKASGSTLLMH